MIHLHPKDKVFILLSKKVWYLDTHVCTLLPGRCLDSDAGWTLPTDRKESSLYLMQSHGNEREGLFIG